MRCLLIKGHLSVLGELIVLGDLMTAYEKRLNVLLEECLAELAAIGIRPCGRILGVKENKRAKKRLGCCRQMKGGTSPEFELELSVMLQDAEEKTLKEVMIHEILHTCRGCLNHGSKWKELAARTKKAYGYSIARTADFEKLGIEAGEEGQKRYRIRCTRCGNTFYRIRKSRVVQHPEYYRCARCGGSDTLVVDQI